MRIKYLIIFIGGALILWFFWDAFRQPGPQDLAGNFQEIAFYRNENNTGPVIRIYAVTVGDTLWAEMEQYGNYMPHNKYGNTKVYFFLKDKPVPQKVFPGSQNFDTEYQKNCIGLYEKNSMSEVSFKKLPFQSNPYH